MAMVKMWLNKCDVKGRMISNLVDTVAYGQNSINSGANLKKLGREGQACIRWLFSRCISRSIQYSFVDPKS